MKAVLLVLIHDTKNLRMPLKGHTEVLLYELQLWQER